MEVRIIPLGYFFRLFIRVFTLGVGSLALWWAERSWPKSMDEQGITARNGKTIAWNECTSFVHVITKRRGSNVTIAEHYDLSSPKGKITFVPNRIEDSKKVIQYAWERLPEKARRGG